MYEDARRAANSEGYTETVFADDLNCYKPFAATCDNRVILADLAECQASLHRWGGANQVTFDPGKESFHVLHRRFPHGGAFKLLGVTFDEKLTMELAINEISAKAHSRVDALLRGRCFFPLCSMARMYKMQVLSFIEAASPALYHAPNFFLSRLDGVQDHFLSELGVDTRDALLNFNLAPLAPRRDMAMLGLIHRTVLGEGPVQFQEFFRASMRPSFPRGLRGNSLRHTRQLHDPMDGTQSNAITRSVLCLVYTYNLLPQAVVDSATVASFQRKLAKALAKACQAELPEWVAFFRTGAWKLSVDSFHGFFV